MSNRFYGSVANKAELANTVYGSVNGEAKRIVRLYGENNGTAKLIHQGFGHATPAYGDVVYYTDNTYTTTGIAVIKSQAEVNSLTGGDTSPYEVNTTIDGVSLDIENIKEVRITSLATSIPDKFLGGCKRLDTVDIAKVPIYTMPNYFLVGCESFNGKIILPSTTTQIGTMFMLNCATFNQLIDFSRITHIGSYFMAGCESFNQTLDFPELVVVANHFLYANSKTPVFNSPVNIPKMVTIGNKFMKGCVHFNQNLTLPSTITSIGNEFMAIMSDMISTIRCDTSATPAPDGSLQVSLYASSTTDPCVQHKIKLSGTYKNEWRNALPDAPLRKLLVV